MRKIHQDDDNPIDEDEIDASESPFTSEGSDDETRLLKKLKKSAMMKEDKPKKVVKKKTAQQTKKDAKKAPKKKPAEKLSAKNAKENIALFKSERRKIESNPDGENQSEMLSSLFMDAEGGDNSDDSGEGGDEILAMMNKPKAPKLEEVTHSDSDEVSKESTDQAEDEPPKQEKSKSNNVPIENFLNIKGLTRNVSFNEAPKPATSADILEFSNDSVDFANIKASQENDSAFKPNKGENIKFFVLDVNDDFYKINGNSHSCK